MLFDTHTHTCIDTSSIRKIRNYVQIALAFVRFQNGFIAFNPCVRALFEWCAICQLAHCIRQHAFAFAIDILQR